MNSSILIKLREENGYTQDDVAKKLGITRQTLSKIEKGESELSADVIKKASVIFNVDYETLIENKISKTYSYKISDTKKEKKTSDIRINIAKKDIEKFKQVFLYILEKVGAKANVGQTVLYKLLYFIDMDYYELYETQLMGLQYIKNIYGPTPIDFAKVVKDMERDGMLEECKTKRFSYDMVKYLPLVHPNLDLLSANEIKHIDSVLMRLSDKSAQELTELSHKDIPWIGTKNKEIIEYEAVFYRNGDTSVREYEHEDD